MGLDYVIQYKKDKENIAADALSRCREEGLTASIMAVIPTWCKEVASSYEGDEKLQMLLEQLIIDPDSKPGYSYTNGVIRYKGRLVIGNKEDLKQKIFQALHASPMGGYSGIQNTYHKVKQLFCWPKFKEEVMQFVLRCDVCKRCKHETVASPGLL